MEVFGISNTVTCIRCVDILLIFYMEEVRKFVAKVNPTGKYHILFSLYGDEEAYNGSDICALYGS